MFSWLTTFGIAAGFAAAGAYVDKLISIRHKTKLHLAMHRWWNRLDETKIPNYLQLLSIWISSRIEKLYRNKHWRMIVVYSLISWFFLTVALFLQSFPVHFDENYHRVPLPSSDQMHNLKPADFFDKLELPHALCFIPLLIFDFLTIKATLSILQILKHSRGIWITVTVIILQIAVVLALAIGCFASQIYVTDFAFNHNLIGARYAREMAEIRQINSFNDDVARKVFVNENLTPDVSVLPLSTNATVIYYHIDDSWLADIKKAPSAFFAFLQGDVAMWEFRETVNFRDGELIRNYSHPETLGLAPSAVATAGTVFFPALIISLVLAFMYLARFVLGVVRGALMYFFDLATEYDPKQFMPATLIGITSGLFVITIKSAWEIFIFIHRL